MSDPMRVKDMTIYDCSKIETEVDADAGCVQIFVYGSDRHVNKFIITLFGPDDSLPELIPATYIMPEEEDQDEDEKESA